MGGWASIPVLDVEINRDSYFINGSTRHGNSWLRDSGWLEEEEFWRRQVHPFSKTACSQGYLKPSQSAIAKQCQLRCLDGDIFLYSWHLIWCLTLEHFIYNDINIITCYEYYIFYNIYLYYFRNVLYYYIIIIFLKTVLILIKLRVWFQMKLNEAWVTSNYSLRKLCPLVVETKKIWKSNNDWQSGQLVENGDGQICTPKSLAGN